MSDTAMASVAPRWAPAPFTPASTRRSTIRAIGALVLREMTTTYGKSPGGFLWAIVEPVAAIALLSFAFSLIFVAPPLGRHFALFYATGFLPFFLLLDVSQKVGSALRFSRPLLGFAGVTWVDALCGRLVLNLLLHLAVAVLVIGGLFYLADGAPRSAATGMALAYSMAAALALAVGIANAYVTGAFPVWERLWAILMRPMFIVSGVIFLFEDVPKPLQSWLEWNPLFHVTGAMRTAMYPTYEPHYLSPVYVFGLALAVALIGASMLHRYHEEILQK